MSLVTPSLTPPESNPTASGLLRRATSRFATTLGAAIDSSVVVVPLDATTDLSADSAVTLVIDPGTDKEEAIIGFPEGSNLVNCARHVEGATVGHDEGAVVMMISTAMDHNSLVDFMRVEHNPDGTHDPSIFQAIALPAGSITLYAGAAAPDGYLLADGASLLRSDYPALFTAIGTVHGAADGTHFNLPNLKGRVPVGKSSTDAEFDTLGETGGEKTHVLSTGEMPSHNHNIQVDFTDGWANGTPQSATQGATVHDPGEFSDRNGTPVASNFVQPAGGGAAHNNLQPYLVLNYVIKT